LTKAAIPAFRSFGARPKCERHHVRVERGMLDALSISVDASLRIEEGC